MRFSALAFGSALLAFACGSRTDVFEENTFVGQGGTQGGQGGAAGSTSVGICTDFDFCGGDLTETWQLKSVCSNTFQVLKGLCKEATVSIQPEGTLTFQANGQYTTTAKAQITVVVPKSCVQRIGHCDDFGSCSMAANGECRCVDKVSPPRSGSWTTDNGVVRLRPASGVDTSADYCRAGSRLRLKIDEDAAFWQYEFAK